MLEREGFEEIAILNSPDGDKILQKLETTLNSLEDVDKVMALSAKMPTVQNYLQLRVLEDDLILVSDELKNLVLDE